MEVSLKRLLALFIALSAALLLSACKPDSLPELTTGELRVSVSPAEATVKVRDSLDNELKEKSSRHWVLPAGSYSVSVAAAGYESHDRTVHVTSGETTAVTVELVKVAGPSSLAITLQDRDTGSAVTGTIEVERVGSDQGWKHSDLAHTSIDGLTEGNYRVSVSAEGYLPWGPQVLSIRSGEDAALAVTLVRQGAIGANVASVRIASIVDGDGLEYEVTDEVAARLVLLAHAGEQVGVTVEVLDESDEPIAGAPVTVNLTGLGTNHVAIYPGKVGGVSASSVVFSGLRTDDQGRAYFILESLVSSPFRSFLVVTAVGDNNVAASTSAAAYFTPKFEYTHVHGVGGADQDEVAVPQRLDAHLGSFQNRYWPGEDNTYRFHTKVEGSHSGLGIPTLIEGGFFVYRVSPPSAIEWAADSDCTMWVNDLESSGLADLAAEVRDGEACVIKDSDEAGFTPVEGELPIEVTIEAELIMVLVNEETYEYSAATFASYSLQKEWLDSSATELHVDPEAITRGIGTLESPLRDLSDALNLIEDGGTIYLHAGDYNGFNVKTPDITVSSYDGEAQVVGTVRVDANGVTLRDLQFELSDEGLTQPLVQGAIEILADDVTVTGSLFTGRGRDYAKPLRAITLRHGIEGATISNNTIEGWLTGVYVNPGDNHTITSNNFTANEAAIGTDNANSLTITNNSFDGNNEDIGLHAADPTITGNSFSAPTAIGWYGGAASVDVSDNIFDGVMPEHASLAELAAIEDMLTHAPDGKAGFLSLREDTIFVTENTTFSIPDAIAYADAGWTVYAAEATYSDALVINKAVRVMADGAELDFGGYGSADSRLIHIQADNVTFSGFTVTGYTTNGGKPILYIEGDKATVSDVSFETDSADSYPYEIVIAEDADSVVVRNNTVTRARIDGHPAIVFMGKNDDLLIDANHVAGGPIAGYVDEFFTATLTNNSVDGALTEGFWFAGAGSYILSGNVVDDANTADDDKADIKFTETPLSINGHTAPTASEAAYIVLNANPGISSVEVPEGGTVYP